jgi:hypothetical protein
MTDHETVSPGIPEMPDLAATLRQSSPLLSLMGCSGRITGYPEVILLGWKRLVNLTWKPDAQG